MRVGAALFLLVLAIVTASCGGGSEAAESPEPTTEQTSAQAEEAAGQAPTFPEGHIVIEKRGEPASVLVEIAETPEQQAYGLMFRESLPPDRGMAFVFESAQTGGFWMKNTLIPLSIAFYDAKGKIVKILDMEPCEADPCQTYEPGVAYRGALEVNQGAFADWGVAEGDKITLHRL